MRKDLHLAYSSPPNINIKVPTLPPSKLSKQDLIWIQILIPTSHYGHNQLHVLLTAKTHRFAAKDTASMSKGCHQTLSWVGSINMNPVRHVWKKACVRQVNFNKLSTTTFKSDSASLSKEWPDTRSQETNPKAYAKDRNCTCSAKCFVMLPVCRIWTKTLLILLLLHHYMHSLFIGYYSYLNIN